MDERSGMLCVAGPSSSSSGAAFGVLLIGPDDFAAGGIEMSFVVAPFAGADVLSFFDLPIIFLLTLPCSALEPPSSVLGNKNSPPILAPADLTACSLEPRSGGAGNCSIISTVRRVSLVVGTIGEVSGSASSTTSTPSERRRLKGRETDRGLALASASACARRGDTGTALSCTACNARWEGLSTLWPAALLGTAC